ncbi:MAG: TIGR03089 family protein, partial [Nocardioides sp.]
MPASTFPDLLAQQLGQDPGRPLVTFYDDETGERIELSVTTYANWVAKTAGLLQDELDVARGETVLLDLPTHWFGPVWLGAAWSIGLRVTDDPALAADARLVVCGPAGIERYADSAADRPVVALSLRPLGAPFAEALPSGVVDYAAVVLGQPDAFFPLDPPAAEDAAWRGTRDLDQAGLLREAAGWSPGGRLLTDVNPCSQDGLVTLLGPLSTSGGTVWVRHPDVDAWE